MFQKPKDELPASEGEVPKETGNLSSLLGSTDPGHSASSLSIHDIATLRRSTNRIPLREKKSAPNQCAGFRKLLYCPGCKELLLPPISLCEQGHSYCSKCRSSNCPICKLATSKGQNFLLELIVRQTELPCQYSKHGCDAILKYSDRNNHEQISCPFKPYICFKCSTQIQMDRLQDHFHGCWPTEIFSAFDSLEIHDQMHPGLTKIFDSKCLNAIVNTQTSWLSLISIREVAIFMVRLIRKGSMWLLWVSVAKCIRDAQMFTYSIGIGPNDGKSKTNYSGPVLSLNVPESEIIEKELGFNINESKIVGALNKDKELVSILKIFRIDRGQVS